MKRKLIVTSIFFVSGLLTTAMITLSLLMSLINRPAAMSVSRIADAVNKSLDVLVKKGELGSTAETRALPGSTPYSTLTLSATIIGKAKLKGILVKEMPAVIPASREFKPVLSGQPSSNRKPEAPASRRKYIRSNYSFKPTNEEALVYKLLFLHYNTASEETRRGIAKKILQLQQADGGWSAVQGRPSDPYATGQALFALQESGMLSPETPDSQKAIAFLLKSQHEDGSWLIASAVSSEVVSGVADADTQKKAIYEDEMIRDTETTHWASLALLESLPDKD